MPVHLSKALSSLNVFSPLLVFFFWGGGHTPFVFHCSFTRRVTALLLLLLLLLLVVPAL